MRIIVYGLFYLSPLFLLNHMVLPELDKLKDFYSNIDATANRAAGVDLHDSDEQSYTFNH